MAEITYLTSKDPPERSEILDLIRDNLFGENGNLFRAAAAVYRRVSPGWAITTPGPHGISEQRRWLARQLMDETLREEDALRIVAGHLALCRVQPTARHALPERGPGSPSRDSLRIIEGDRS